MGQTQILSSPGFVFLGAKSVGSGVCPGINKPEYECYENVAAASMQAG